MSGGRITQDVACAFCSGTLLASLVATVLVSYSATRNTEWVATMGSATAAFASRAAKVPVAAPASDAATAQSICGWQSPRILEPVDNPLWTIFQAHTKGPVIHKWHQYFDIYDRYFKRFRGRTLNFMEIGVQSGGTLTMWREYFGDGLNMTGVDINGYCKALFDDPPNINIYLGDQSDRSFWNKMRTLNMTFDVILDDGGHTMDMQIRTFEETWPMLNSNGVYICEDTATSYETGYGGGYGKPSTWIEYAKRFADIVHGHYVDKSLHPDFDPAGLTASMMSAAFYDQMVVLEKGSHPPAINTRKGNFEIPYNDVNRQSVEPKLLAQYRENLTMALQ